MSHEVETMAYAGETPWHGLGVRVSNDLSPTQMMKKAGLDWTVSQRPVFMKVGDNFIEIPGKRALARDTDDKFLTISSEHWKPHQNENAFEFYHEFFTRNEIEMHTAGSLCGGQKIWILAKLKESFEILKTDRIESYLLFTNSHRMGLSHDIRFTPVRVVCNNTWTQAMDDATRSFVRIAHSQKIDFEAVKQMLGLSSDLMKEYKEKAVFLSKKKAKKDDIVSYFKELYGLEDSKDNSDRKNTRNANTLARLESLLQTQPGAEYGEGTWWPVFNTITFSVDHIEGKGERDGKLDSAWFGHGMRRKQKAMELALQYAA